MWGEQQLNRYIFPGSLRRTSAQALTERYQPENATIFSLPTPRGYMAGVLYGEPVQAEGAVIPQSEKRCMIFCYGNNGGLDAIAYEFSFFRRLGCHTIIPEYEGYGMSGGSASELGCYEAADLAYTFARERLHFAESDTFLCGHSLGAAVVTDLAARTGCAGLLLISAFTSLKDEAAAVYRWLPKRVLEYTIGNRFDVLAKISRVAAPIFISHGEDDEVIPFAMAERLVSQITPPQKVTFYPVALCKHNDILDKLDVWGEMRRFLDTVHQW